MVPGVGRVSRLKLRSGFRSDFFDFFAVGLFGRGDDDDDDGPFFGI